MSNWTHVTAMARVDHIVFDDSDELDFEEIFGRECLYNSSDEIWENARKNPDKFLPMGSEGSLQMSVWTNPRKEHAARYTVSIFGDLRDHDNAEKIVMWFKDKCENEICSVRSAFIVAENDYAKHTAVWIYKNKWLDEKPVKLL